MDREARKRDMETSNKRVTTFWIMGSRKIEERDILPIIPR